LGEVTTAVFQDIAVNVIKQFVGLFPFYPHGPPEFPYTGCRYITGLGKKRLGIIIAKG
jgi:hypothetical protein